MLRVTGPLAYMWSVTVASRHLGCTHSLIRRPAPSDCRSATGGGGAMQRLHFCDSRLPKGVPRAEYYWYCGGAVVHWDCRNSPAAHGHPHTDALT